MRLFLPQCARVLLETIADLSPDELANIHLSELAARSYMHRMTAFYQIKFLKSVGLIECQHEPGRGHGYSIRVRDQGYRCLGRYF